MNFVIQDIKDCVFKDKSGKEVFHLDKIRNMDVKTSASVGEIPTIDCNLTAYNFELYQPGEETTKIQNQKDRFKIVYRGE